MNRSKYTHEVYNSKGVSYGTTTDIYLLPVGTTFEVSNGFWTGEIIERRGKKFIKIIDGYEGTPYEYEKLIELKEDVDYGLVITIKEKVVDDSEGTIYKHYKGSLYQVLSEATHTESGETLIIYSDKDNNIWARPKDMFFGTLEHEGKTVKRFTKVK